MRPVLIVGGGTIGPVMPLWQGGRARRLLLRIAAKDAAHAAWERFFTAPVRSARGRRLG